MNIGVKTKWFFAALVGLLLFACSGETSRIETPARHVSDDLGRTVLLPEKIERAVSLAPNLTEMIFAVGAGDRLVGVTTFCNYPAKASTKEKIGDTQTPNIEKIIALRPQIVFVSTASQLEAFSTTLNEQGIAMYVSDQSNLEQVFDDLRSLGRLFGTEGTAERLVTSLSQRAANVKKTDLPRPRVFVQISEEPLFTVGADSFLTPVIEQAGGISVTADVPTAYPKLSKETAAALDPDVIVLSDSEDNRQPSSALKDSKAVKTGRVYRINADIISRPGPRLVDALEEIAMRLREKGS